MPDLSVPAGLVGTLAILAFGLAIVGMLVAPLFVRRRRDPGATAALALVPFALLTVAAVLAASAAALGTVSAQRVGVREVTTGALALICLTPVLGGLYVRLRYGSTGKRTFHQQIAGNRVSSIMLVAILFEILLVTGFLIGAAVGILADVPLLTGLVFAGLSLVATIAATAVRDGAGATGSSSTSRARSRPARVDVRASCATSCGSCRSRRTCRPPRCTSSRRPAANAFAVGRDSQHASIAVTSGLLATLDREELQGVVAHELAHVANLDSRHGLLVALLVGAVVILTDVFFEMVVEMATHPSFDADSISELIAGIVMWLVISAIAIVFAGALKLFAPLAARAVQAAVSRDREYLADATSVAMTRNPAGLMSALRKLEAGSGSLPHANRGTQHLWIVNPVREAHEGGRGWFDTHPSTIDRIARLRELAGEHAEREDPTPRPTPASVEEPSSS